MKGKLVNKKVVNSIGIGILAFVTASTPVLEVCAAEGDEGLNAAGSPQTTEHGEVENVEKNEPTSTEIAFGEANEALENAKNPTISGEEGSSVEVKDEIVESIGYTQEAVKNLESENGAGSVTAAQKEAQEAADELNNILQDDEITTGDGTAITGDTMADNVSQANQKADQTQQSTKKGEDDIQAIVGEVDSLKSETYQNAAAAQEAEAEAKRKLEDAEEIYAEADAAVKEADAAVETAKASKDFLEQQYQEATDAYNNAKEKVEAANQALEDFLKENGLQEAFENGTLTPDQLKGDAADAFKNLKTALETAVSDLSDAASAKNEAEEKAKDAQEQLNKATEELTGKREELKKAADNLDADKNAVDAEAAGKIETAEAEAKAEKEAAQEEAKAKIEQAEADAAAAVEREKEAQGKYDNFTTNNQALENLLESVQTKNPEAQEAYQKLLELENDPRQKMMTTDASAYWKWYWEIKNASTEAWAKLDAVATDLIKFYVLQNEGASDPDQIKFGEWKGTDDTKSQQNNHIEVSYVDSQGNKKTVYYDYEFEDGKISIIKKPEPKKKWDGSLEFPGKSDGSVNFSIEDFNNGMSEYQKEREELNNAIIEAKADQEKAKQDKADALAEEQEKKGAADAKLEAATEAAEKEAQEKKEALAENIRNIEGEIESLTNEIKEFNNLLNQAADANNKYIAASTIKDAVDNAYAKVQTLLQTLADMENQDINEEAYQKIKARYDKAVEEYNAAVKNQTVYQASLDAIAAALDNIRQAANGSFSFASSGSGGSTTTQPTTGGGTDDNDGGNTPQNPTETEGGSGEGTDGVSTAPTTAPIMTAETAETIIDVAVDQTNTEGIGLVATVGNNVGAATGNLQGAGAADEEDGDGELEIILDEEIPLADADLEDADDSASDTETALVAVDEEEVPLADLEVEKTRMSWWWLLIIALLGVTGEEMYRRHKKKMEEENAVK